MRFLPKFFVLVFLLLAQDGFAQIVGSSTNLLDDNVTFSATNLLVKRYNTLPNLNSSVGSQTTRRIISLTNRPDDNATYVSSQNGKIHRLAPNASGTADAAEWFDVNASVAVEPSNTFHGGLRGIAFHPDFGNSSAAGYGKFYGSLIARDELTSNSPLYIGSSNYAQGREDSVVAEWTYDFTSNAVNSSSYRELFRVKNPQLDHPIKQLGFNSTANASDEDYGLLYVAHGDGSVLGSFSGTGQVLGNALGKILRVNPLDPDGGGSLRYSTPGNTFAADGIASTLSEIYSAGHRNPHNFSFFKRDDGSTVLITAEIGQDNMDEINVVDINTNQNGQTNGFDYGWSDREGVFKRNGNNRSYGVGNGVVLNPANDEGNEYIYPSLAVDHNDPSGSDRFALAGGSILDGRYFFSNFPTGGGEIFSVSGDDLLNQKTTFDATLGEDFGDITFLDDYQQHRIEFDHDNDLITPSIIFDDFADLLGTSRSDIRFGTTSDGRMLFSSKQNGSVYLVSNFGLQTVPEPSSALVFVGISCVAFLRRRRQCRPSK